MNTPIDSDDLNVHGLRVAEDTASAGMALDISGLAVQTNVLTGGTGIVYISLGAAYDNATRGLNGTITHFLIFDSELSVSDTTAVKAYLAGLGGISW